MTNPAPDVTVPHPDAVRRPYTGSCHCGATKYVAFLTLPHFQLSLSRAPEAIAANRGRMRLYKCNCTTCHKAGLFHIRLASPADDFLLLTPLDPFTALGDYTCQDRELHFLFCRACGGRCLTLAGEGVVEEVDLAALGVGEEARTRLGVGEGAKVKAWRPKREGWDEGVSSYLSVNAYSLDVQDGLSLPEWTEKKWVRYIDCLNATEDPNYERPCTGGSY